MRRHRDLAPLLLTAALGPFLVLPVLRRRHALETPCVGKKVETLDSDALRPVAATSAWPSFLMLIVSLVAQLFIGEPRLTS